MAELAMDGKYSINTYLNHTLGIGPKNLSDFTVCLRFNVNYLKTWTSALLSYSTFFSSNSLNIEIVQESGKSGKTLHIFMCKYNIKQGCGRFKMNNMRIHNEWHHVCMALKTDDFDMDKFQVTRKFYFDGKEVNKGNVFLIFKF